MEGELTVAEWRDDTPPVGQVVEVWDWLAVVRAVWTGEEWHTPDGMRLRWISHWRPCDG